MAFDEIREKLFSATQKSRKPSEFGKDQGMEEQKLCAFVKGKIEDVRGYASRVSHEGIWLTNIAYLLGFDSIYYDTNMRQFRPLQYPGQFLRRNRISVNKILPSAQNRAARLTKSPPRYDVRPKSMSQEDKDASRLGIYLINQIWDQQAINKKRLELIMWTQQCGHAYLKTVWDKTLGPKIPLDGKMVPIGDIRVDVVNAFEVFPDPLAKSFEELNWIVHARIRPIHYFRDHYGEKGALVTPEDVWLTSLQYEYRINSFNSQAGAAGGVSNLIKDSAIELCYYEKPNYRHPNGRCIVVANGVLLKDYELPINELPFSKFDDVMIAGKFYSESVITHARPIQDQYNRTIAQRADWVNKLLTGKMLAAKGHGLHREALNDQSGEIVEYNPVPNAGPPQHLPMPTIPQYAYIEEERLAAMIDNIFGLSEPSQGQLPSASIPAIGLQYLVEQDMTRIGVMTEQHEHAYAATGRQILKYAEKHYKTPRLLKVSGKSMEYTVKEFRGADIKGNNEVMVIRGSTLPGSKVLKRQEIINLHQGGYLGDPADPKVMENVLNMLEYGEIQEVWKDHSLDMGQIKKKISQIEEGIMPEVSEFDNHPLIIKELNRYRKSEKYDSLSEDSKKILIETMESHVQEMLNMQSPETNIDADPGMQPSNEAAAMEAEMTDQMGPLPDEIPEPEGL